MDQRLWPKKFSRIASARHPRGRSIGLAAIVSVVSLGCVSASRPSGEDGVPPSLDAENSSERTAITWYPAPTEAEQKLEAMLDTRMPEASFVDLHLGKVIDWLREFTGLAIRVDWEALSDKDIGLTRDTPVNYVAHDLALRYVITGVFESLRPQLDLVQEFESGPRIAVDEFDNITRMYPVADLLALDLEWRRRLHRCGIDCPTIVGECDDLRLSTFWPESLVELISTCVAPDSWEASGGIGTIQLFGPTLVIRTSREVHREIAGLLVAIRAAAGSATSASSRWTVSTQPIALRPTTSQAPPGRRLFKFRTAAEDRFEARLGTRIPEVSFQECYFEMLCEWLTGYSGVPIIVDWATLAEKGIDRDKPITINTRDLTLDQCLWLMIEDAGGRDVELGYEVRPTGIAITTAEKLRLTTRVYAVPDLLLAAYAWRHAPFVVPPESERHSATQPTLRMSICFSDWDGTISRSDPGDLMALITSAVEPDQWVGNGGEGSIATLGPLLVVRMAFRPGPDPAETFLDALSASLEHP